MINAAAGHHITEGRWLRDGRYLNSYLRYFYKEDRPDHKTVRRHPKHADTGRIEVDVLDGDKSNGRSDGGDGDGDGGDGDGDEYGGDDGGGLINRNEEDSYVNSSKNANRDKCLPKNPTGPGKPRR